MHAKSMFDLEAAAAESSFLALLINVSILITAMGVNRSVTEQSTYPRVKKCVVFFELLNNSSFARHIKHTYKNISLSQNINKQSTKDPPGIEPGHVQLKNRANGPSRLCGSCLYLSRGSIMCHSKREACIFVHCKVKFTCAKTDTINTRPAESKKVW